MKELKLKNIYKSFGEQKVLKGVDFSVKSGEVHALLGANGAGKSTLMKILSGDYQPDSGAIFLDNKHVTISSPKEAKASGIEMVVQEVDTALVQTLSIAENVTMNKLLNGPLILSKKNRMLEAKQLLARVGLYIDPTLPLSRCTLAQKQLVLIAKALSQEISFMILDEPTAPLSHYETEHLFHVLRSLQKDGVGIIYISHRIQEVKELSTRITVLKDGCIAIQKENNRTTTDEIIHAMLGEALSNVQTNKARRTLDKTLLEVKNFTVPKTNEKISLTVKEGEIVGIAGLVGAGKTETARALFGAEPSSDPLFIKGKKIKISNPKKAILNGISFIPEERRKEGILTEYNVVENLTLPVIKQFSKLGFLKRKEEIEKAEQWIDRLKIKTSSSSEKLEYLSGGNQQKTAIGKWLLNDGDLFIFDEPTKGIDIGAKQDVFSCIQELATSGKGILYFSSEFSELLALCDRIVIMVKGRIVGELTSEEATLENIMELATGGYHERTGI